MLTTTPPYCPSSFTVIDEKMYKCDLCGISEELCCLIWLHEVVAVIMVSSFTMAPWKTL